MIKNFVYEIPTKLLFGCGKLNELSSEILPGQKALIVSSETDHMRAQGFLSALTEQLQGKGVDYEVYSDILDRPTKDTIEKGNLYIIEKGCDFIIALGERNAIDTAKAIAITSVNDGSIWDFLFNRVSGAFHPTKVVPLITIPTMSGLGVEVDKWVLLTQAGKRHGYGNKMLFPTMTIVDPELTLNGDKNQTALHGIDAMFHAIEGYISSMATPLSDMLALKSIQLLAKSLPAVIKNSDNLDARCDLALASILSGIVISTSNCLSSHGLAYSMSEKFPNITHSAFLSAIAIPYYTMFQEERVAKYKSMAEILTGNKNASHKDFIKSLATFLKNCGFKNSKLSDFGIQQSELTDYISNTRKYKGWLFAIDPHLITDEEIEKILISAL